MGIVESWKKGDNFCRKVVLSKFKGPVYFFKLGGNFFKNVHDVGLLNFLTILPLASYMLDFKANL